MIETLYFCGHSIEVYNICNVLAFFVLMAFNLQQRNRAFLGLTGGPAEPQNCGEPNAVTPKIWLIAALSLVQFLGGVLMNVAVGELFNGGGYNYFGFAILAPILFVVFCKIIKLDGWGYLDAFAPAYAISLVLLKIGCFCAGCCGGADIGPTLFYPRQSLYRFPIQLLEAFVALCIFLFLLRYRKKAQRGTMHPMFLILYSATRFFTEFLRHEKDIFLVFKLYHIFCIVGVIVGVAAYKAHKARNLRDRKKCRRKATRIKA